MLAVNFNTLLTSQPFRLVADATKKNWRNVDRQVGVRTKAAGRQEVIAQRRKLKDAKSSDQQTDANLEASEAVAPDLVTKSDLALFKVEIRVLFSVVLFVVTASAGRDSPVAAFIKAVFDIDK